MDLADALAKLGLGQSQDLVMASNGFEVTYDGAPGSLIAHLTSSDASGDYSFEVPVKDPAGKNATAGGGYPWTLQDGTDTTLHLMNTSDKATWAIVELRFPDGTTYDPQRMTVAPHQTVAIDLQELRNGKETDIHHNLFRAKQDHGQLIWSQGTIHALIGRAEQVNAGEGFARSFSCGECACPNSEQSAFLDAATTIFPIGYDNTTGYADYYAYEYVLDCNNNQYGPYAVSGDWWTGDTSIAAVTANSEGDGAMISALNGGSTTIGETWQTEYWYDTGFGFCSDVTYPADASGPVSVQVPTKDRLVATDASYAINSSTSPACPSGTAGWYRNVTKIVVDQNGSDITQPGQQLTEIVTITNNGLNAPSPQTGSTTTGSGGYFGDTYEICVPACPASGNQTDATQTITDTPVSYSSTSYTLAANSLEYTCTGNYVNGN